MARYIATALVVVSVVALASAAPMRVKRQTDENLLAKVYLGLDMLHKLSVSLKGYD